MGHTDLSDNFVSAQGSAAEAPLFVLSFRHRDELASAVSHAGWHAIAARRADNAEQRFLASFAMVAVVDARGAFDDGLAAVRSLADAVEINAASLLVLVSRTDVDRLDELVAAGATHYLASPFKENELLQLCDLPSDMPFALPEAFVRSSAGGRLMSKVSWPGRRTFKAGAQQSARPCAGGLGRRHVTSV